MHAVDKKGFIPLRATVDAEFEMEALAAMEEKVKVLEKELEDRLTTLKNNDSLAERRRKPLVENIEALRTEVDKLRNAITIATTTVEDDIPHPGPPWMSWVDSWQFVAFCNLVICLNLVQMIFASSSPIPITHLLNHIFLLWYLSELTLKSVYHQWNLFFGPIQNVWWSWLDALVVSSGIVELWLFPLLELAGVLQSTSRSPLQYLRLLRLFRLLRFIKILRIIVDFDINIITTREFEFFMNAVIFLNAVAMGLQLDIKWWAWMWIDQLFLFIYVVELSARAKFLGFRFFTDPETITWNYLDLSIVCAGIFDQWLTPAMALIHKCTSGDTTDDEVKHGSAMQLLRFMRLFRVLRLAKLLKAIPPLHRLLVGVMKALESMKWVLALTSLILYSAAIIFTTLVTKHILATDSDQGCLDNFGSVAASLFSLFKLMNGDTDIATCFTITAAGKLLFVTFMVLSNWAILAILTSVVSDNMIQASMELVDKEKEQSAELQNEENRMLLFNLFHEVDQNGSGSIDEHEWKNLIADDGLRDVLLEASGLRERDLMNLFECLAEEDEHENGRVVKVLHYEHLLGALRNHDQAVDHRAIMKLMMRIIKMEKVFNHRFDRLYRNVSNGEPSTPTLSRSKTMPATTPRRPR